MIVTANAQTVPLTNTGWAITGSGTAVQILAGGNPSNYLSAQAPFLPPNSGVLIATNFGFAIPALSTITGVAFGIGYKNTQAIGPSASLTKDGVNPDLYYQAPSSGVWAGWGIGPITGYTVAQINASTFGLMVDPPVGRHYLDYLYIQVTYVPSDYRYSGSAVLGFTTNSSYSVHQAAGVNAYSYAGSAVFGFTTNSSYSFGSASSGLPYEGVSQTAALYTGTSDTKP
jgi:hypothetical protein